jgi:hypothetical protein
MNEMNNNRIKGLLLILLILGATYAFIVIVMLIPEKKQKAAEPDSSKVATKSAGFDIGDQAIIRKAGRHIYLPSGTPKVVPVLDADKLRKEQPFFANAKNGDMLLVYPNKVIIFSLVEDKIVEVATIK